MALGSALAVLATCTSTQLPVTARPRSAGQDLYQDLYEDRCGRCHDVFPAHAYPRSEWPAIVRRMSVEARLTDLETRQVLLWLQEGR
jgi:hypothetical protein